MERESDSGRDDVELDTVVAELVQTESLEETKVIKNLLSGSFIANPEKADYSKDVNGKSINHELHAPFAYLETLVAITKNTDSDKSGSEQVHDGSQFDTNVRKPSTDSIEGFLASLRFEQRDKLAGLPIELDV